MSGKSKKNFKSNGRNSARNGKGRSYDGASKATESYDKDFNKGRIRDRNPDACNDPAWYATTPELMRDAASIPFSWATGTESQLGSGYYGTAGDTFNFSFIAPGICQLRVAPSIGYSIDATSPINVAAASFFATVRKANSGRINYESPDLMMYCIAIGQVYSAINWLQREYGIIRTYSQRNRYMAETLASAAAGNTSSTLSSYYNYADFRYGINLLITKAASFSVPSNLNYFRRMAFLFSNVYTEGDSIKDQLYLYAPAGFYKLSSDSTGRRKLVFESIPGFTNLNAMISYVDGLIQPLLSDEDFNIMSGDILKAFGEENCLKLQYMSEDYNVIPTFNIGVLEQMKNCDMVTYYNSNLPPDITQVVVDLDGDTNAYLECQLTYTNDLLSIPRLLTTTTEYVGPELVMENSRGMVAGIKEGENAALYTGSDFVVNAYAWKFGEENSGVNQIPIRYDVAYSYPKSGASFTFPIASYDTMVMRMQFRFCPRGYALSTASNAPGKYFLEGLLHNVDNYAVVTPENIKRFHETALMSMLNVPVIEPTR